ncbi:hypothetical protein OAA19_03545 [Rubripirellula sp.]|nr:hypothetical protein [Rubripirellula sp.]MDB4339166.1 hypothetical protein [Rubripirellula sp.]
MSIELHVSELLTVGVSIVFSQALTKESPMYLNDPVDCFVAD